MKLKNINTLAPCLSALYVTMGSDGKNVIYLSALDKNEEDFILAADKNSHLADMQKEVNDKLQEAINADEAFRQLYQTMDQAIANVSSTPEPQADAAQPTAEPAAADPNAAATTDPNAAPAADPNAAATTDPNAAPVADPNAAPTADPNAAPAQ